MTGSPHKAFSSQPKARSPGQGLLDDVGHLARTAAPSFRMEHGLLREPVVRGGDGPESLAAAFQSVARPVIRDNSPRRSGTSAQAEAEHRRKGEQLRQSVASIRAVARRTVFAGLHGECDMKYRNVPQQKHSSIGEPLEHSIDQQPESLR